MGRLASEKKMRELMTPKNLKEAKNKNKRKGTISSILPLFSFYEALQVTKYI